jgi:hypothetical protein
VGAITAGRRQIGAWGSGGGRACVTSLHGVDGAAARTWMPAWPMWMEMTSRMVAVRLLCGPGRFVAARKGHRDAGFKDQGPVLNVWQRIMALKRRFLAFHHSHQHGPPGCPCLLAVSLIGSRGIRATENVVMLAGQGPGVLRHYGSGARCWFF